VELKDKIKLQIDAVKYDASCASSGVIRECLLYLTDWLLRFYDFSVHKILPVDVSKLSLKMDPKFSWAILNRATFPIDLNMASSEILLRIPGQGVRNVDKLLAIRKFQKFRLTDLSKMQVHLNKIRPFVVIQGYNPPAPQLDSLHFAKFFWPETHVQLDLSRAFQSM
jgi:predicted DNA-binding helix-hairpin-helix protein